MEENESEKEACKILGHMPVMVLIGGTLENPLTEMRCERCKEKITAPKQKKKRD